MLSTRIPTAESPARSKLVLIVIVIVVFGASFLAKGLLVIPPRETASGSRDCRRIISMAPSVTETLFALGLGDRVVGVTRYCDYPPEALEKAKVGGFHNPNYEAIMALRPDLVVMLEADAQPRQVFDTLGVDTLQMHHKSIDGILDSIDLLGSTFGAEARAEEITSDIRARLERVERKTAGRTCPTVMFSIDRTLGTGRLEDVYIAGCDGHIDRIIELAGGRNVYQQGVARFPVVSHEGMIKMNPQVIVDLVGGLSVRKVSNEEVAADWEQLTEVDAVRQGKVFVMDDDYAFVPGPRFILLVEKLARLIHPEVDWEE
jgi:cobalamin transport system substrate-binding protein